MIVQSKNFPSRYWADAETDDKWGLDVQIQATKFNIISPGLTGKYGTVSFQSVDDPDKYLRHVNMIVYLESKTNPRNPKSFNKDATFILHTDR